MARAAGVNEGLEESLARRARHFFRMPLDADFPRNIAFGIGFTRAHVFDGFDDPVRARSDHAMHWADGANGLMMQAVYVASLGLEDPGQQTRPFDENCVTRVRRELVT